MRESERESEREIAKHLNSLNSPIWESISKSKNRNKRNTTIDTNVNAKSNWNVLNQVYSFEAKQANKQTEMKTIIHTYTHAASQNLIFTAKNNRICSKN